MAEFVIWLVLFGLLASGVLIIHYWYSLIQHRDSYSRADLVDFGAILNQQLHRLIGKRDVPLGYGALAVGAGIAWFLTLLGGLVSPDTTSAPDFASASIPNYFFQSILFPAILHLLWPSLRELAGSGGMAIRLLATARPLFFGLAIALGAINITVWGLYHETSFLFCLINNILALGYAGYRLDLEEPENGGQPPGRGGKSGDDLSDEILSDRASEENNPGDY